MLGGWRLEQLYSAESLRMGIYVRIGTDDKTEYVIANAGTDPSGLWTFAEDMQDNIQQPFGISRDMEFSISFAEDFVKNHRDANITFVGHSKGGAEAAANAVATKRDAIVFNPATVNLNAYGLDSSIYTAEITAYIVKGEILNNTFGAISEPIDSVVYLPSQYNVDTSSRLLNVYNSIRNHSMEAVKEAIKVWKGEK